MSIDIPFVVQDILDGHHAPLHRELARLDAALEGAPAALRDPWLELSVLLARHLAREEQLVFPLVIRLAGGDTAAAGAVAAPLAALQADHERLGALEDELRGVAALAGGEAAALRALLDDLALHTGKEDDLLFPAVRFLAGTPARRDPPRARPAVARVVPSAGAGPRRRSLRARIRAVLFERTRRGT